MTAATVGGTRRRELLGIAGELFAEHGYHGTSIRLIADRAGLQSATLYSHFRSKAAIFRELLDGYFAALLPALEEASAAPAPAGERLTAMISVAIEIGQAHRDAFIMLSNDWRHIRTSADLQELVECRNRASALWAKVLDDAVADGSVRAEDVGDGDALWIVYALITGMVDNRYDAVDDRVHDAPTATLQRVLERGLIRQPSSPA